MAASVRRFRSSATAIRLRYRLMPYLYSLYWRASQFGEPILRPIFYEFERDPLAFEDCDDFMFGPNLLVASVVEPGQRVRRVYLPRGPSDWLDFWTGQRHRAGTAVDLAAPLDRIPLLVPAGGDHPDHRLRGHASKARRTVARAANLPGSRFRRELLYAVRGRWPYARVSRRRFRAGRDRTGLDAETDAHSSTPDGPVSTSLRDDAGDAATR